MSNTSTLRDNRFHVIPYFGYVDSEVETEVPHMLGLL